MDPHDEFVAAITEARQLHQAGSQVLSFERLCDAMEALSVRVEFIGQIVLTTNQDARKLAQTLAGLAKGGEA